MCSLVSETKLTMDSGEIELELRPSITGNCSGLPRSTCIGKKSRVKYECLCHVDDHGSAIGLTARYRKGSSVLDLLEERLDRLIRIIWRVEALIVLREFSRCNHSIVC
jgi:hypothetical protein